MVINTRCDLIKFRNSAWTWRLTALGGFIGPSDGFKCRLVIYNSQFWSKWAKMLDSLCGPNCAVDILHSQNKNTIGLAQKTKPIVLVKDRMSFRRPHRPVVHGRRMSFFYRILIPLEVFAKLAAQSLLNIDLFRSHRKSFFICNSLFSLFVYFILCFFDCRYYVFFRNK